MRSLLVLAALVPCVEALMLTCTPRPRSAKLVVFMRAQSNSALLQSAQEKVATLSRLADMADTAIKAKDTRPSKPRTILSILIECVRRRTTHSSAVPA